MTPETTADESGTDAQALAGTPVGGSGGNAACDTCNRRLTDGQRPADDSDADADTVVVYATRARVSNTWGLRWVSCEACGSPADGKDLEDREAVAKATLGYETRIGAFVLEDVRDVEVGGH